jgi:hypothetical protein
VLAALLVIGCLAFWFGVKKDAGPLVIGGATLLGLAGSVGYERRIGGVLRLAALGGGCVFWMGAVVVWSGVARPVLESFGAWHRVTLGTIYVLPVFGLPIGAGAMAWYQAIADTHRGRFDWSRVFPASIASCAGMIVVGLLVCLSVLLGATRIPHSARFSVMTAAICVGVTGAIWLVVLKRIAGLRPRHGLRAIVAWVVLIVLFPLTFGLAGLIEGADGWGNWSWWSACRWRSGPGCSSPWPCRGCWAG